MKKVLSIIIIVLITFAAFSPGIAMAEDSPDSVSLESIKWFRNAAADGDIVGVFHYNIEYGSYPDTPASSTFEFRLYSGSDLIAVSKPYVFASFATDGYGNGVSGFYFDPDDEDIPTWGEALVLTIYGLPMYFESPSDFVLNYTMEAADYTDSVTQEDNREDIYNEVIDLCDTFKTIYPDVPLKTTTDSGIVLSDYGDSYFRNAIPGLQNMCPALFFIQIYNPEIMEVDEYDMSVAVTAGAILDGTDLDRGVTRLGDVIGVTGTFIWGLIYFGLCLFVMIKFSKKGWGIEPALVICFLIGLGFALLVGDLMFTLVMIGGLVAAMGIMYVITFKRA